MAYLFQIPWWAGVLALPLSVVMGVIAARVTGETDTTPTKALGPVTQLIYGGLAARQPRRQRDERQCHGRRGPARGGPADGPQDRAGCSAPTRASSSSRSSSAWWPGRRWWCRPSTCWCRARTCWAPRSSRRPRRWCGPACRRCSSTGVSALHQSPASARCAALSLGVGAGAAGSLGAEEGQAVHPVGRGLRDWPSSFRAPAPLPSSSARPSPRCLRRFKPKLAEATVLPGGLGLHRWREPHGHRRGDAQGLRDDAEVGRGLRVGDPRAPRSAFRVAGASFVLMPVLGGTWQAIRRTQVSRDPGDGPVCTRPPYDRWIPSTPLIRAGTGRLTRSARSPCS